MSPCPRQKNAFLKTEVEAALVEVRAVMVPNIDICLVAGDITSALTLTPVAE